jgi:hypothetical protein
MQMQDINHNNQNKRDLPITLDVFKWRKNGLQN